MFPGSIFRQPERQVQRLVERSAEKLEPVDLPGAVLRREAEDIRLDFGFRVFQNGTTVDRHKLGAWDDAPPASVSLAKIEAMLAAWLGVSARRSYRRRPSRSRKCATSSSIEALGDNFLVSCIALLRGA